jgi:hypothetical protein
MFKFYGGMLVGCRHSVVELYRVQMRKGMPLANAWRVIPPSINPAIFCATS